MRGLKDGAPGCLSSKLLARSVDAHNPLKRPGEMRLLSYQAIAHGADGVMFFQWRQSREPRRCSMARRKPRGAREYSSLPRRRSAGG